MLGLRRFGAVLVALIMVGACFVLPLNTPAAASMPMRATAGHMIPLRFAHEEQPLDYVLRPCTALLPEPNQPNCRQTFIHVALAVLLALLTLLFGICILPEKVKPPHIIFAFCHALRAPPAAA